MAEQYDFTIDTLKFRCAINEKTPYARSTAPFRKDQFDAAPTPGDQSLTGWWTRGQLSFHKGGGVEYYEITDGEAVLNRSKYTTNMDVSTPGKVTLNKALRSFTINAYPQDIVMAGSTIYYRSKDSTKLYRLNNTSASEDYAAGTPTAVTLSGTQPTAACKGPTFAQAYVATYTGNGYAKLEAVTNGGASPATLVVWTHHIVNSRWDKLWALKDRIMAQDGSGRVMFLSPYGAGQATTDSMVFEKRDVTDLYEHAVETAGPILASAKNKIYALTIDTSASVPTPLPGVVVAQLPSDEVITGLANVLGYVVIATTKGVRVAQMDGTGLVYGPLVLALSNVGDSSGSTTRMAVQGTSALASGLGPAGLGVYQIDLGQTVDSLLPAWTCRWLHPSPQSTLTSLSYGSGVWVDIYGGVVFIDERGTSTTTAYAAYSPSDTATGHTFLTGPGRAHTGYHRFGTLESKLFYNVSVRLSGTNGFVLVKVVKSDGAVVTLGAAVPADGTTTFPILDDQGRRIVDESIALIFDFIPATDINGNPVDAPTLLGYQLRAMPAPQRQRILKVPLVIQDHVRLKGGVDTGRKGRAWSDLQALEALESTKAIVPFTDHRTGETGSAFIDSVDFQGETPATAQSNGFGGTAYVTLRVVS